MPAVERKRFFLKNAEVVEKGVRKDKDGKQKPWFKVLTRGEGGEVDLHYISGDGVEVGKVYDFPVMAFSDAKIFLTKSNNDHEPVLSSAGSSAKGKF